MLKTQEPADLPQEISGTTFTISNGNISRGAGPPPSSNVDFEVPNPNISVNNERDSDRWQFNGDSPQPVIDDMTFNTSLGLDIGMNDNTFTWEMIGLGLEEPLPPQETIDEL